MVPSGTGIKAVTEMTALGFWSRVPCLECLQENFLSTCPELTSKQDCCPGTVRKVPSHVVYYKERRHYGRSVSGQPSCAVIVEARTWRPVILLRLLMYLFGNFYNNTIILLRNYPYLNTCHRIPQPLSLGSGS